jgi:two-component system cell cycle response regulator DivK
MTMSTSKSLESAETAQTLRRQRSANHQRILVVEDHPISLALLHQLLKAYGYETLKTSEGLDAINLARTHQPDLILMDIRLPDISGLDATRLLKQDDQTKDIPIIAVTAFATPGDESHALESGCDAYVAKPVNMDRLLQTIRLLLGSAPLPV